MSGWLVTLSCRAMLALSAALPATAGDSDAYTVELVALHPGVYLIRRPDPLREPVEANAIFVVNEDGVLVFEGGGAPLVAERTIALIQSVTDKPVTHVVNSHWHGDHNLGNQVYKTMFPDARFIGHPETRGAMTGSPMSYVQRFALSLGDLIADWKAQQRRGEL